MTKGPFDFLSDDRSMARNLLTLGLRRILGCIKSTRAIEGHTFQIDLTQNQLLPNDVRYLYHGTELKHLSFIEPLGLIPGGGGLTERPENYFSARAFRDIKPTGPSEIPGYRFGSEIETQVTSRSLKVWDARFT